MLLRVALVRTDVSEELSASFIRVIIGELGITLAIASYWRMCVLALSSSETSVLTRATRLNIPENAFLQSRIPSAPNFHLNSCAATPQVKICDNSFAVSVVFGSWYMIAKSDLRPAKTSGLFCPPEANPMSKFQLLQSDGPNLATHIKTGFLLSSLLSLRT
jgi:hypothetical protein